MQDSTRSRFQPQIKVAASLCEPLTNRLLNELQALNAPEQVFELVHGLSFMSSFALGDQHLPQMQSDFPDALSRCVDALGGRLC